MAKTITFEELLQVVSKADRSGLESKRAALEAKKSQLQKELAQVNEELAKVESELLAPIRQAVRAAKELGIPVPEGYLNNGRKADSPRPKGKFFWEVEGQVPFQAEVSRAMWRLSRGSGGTVGKAGEGVLSSEEFWNLVGIPEAQMPVGEKRTVTLPNGKTVSFQRLE